MKSSQLGRLTFFFFFPLRFLLFCRRRTYLLLVHPRLLPRLSSGTERVVKGPRWSTHCSSTSRVVVSCQGDLQATQNQTATNRNIYASRVSVYYHLYKPIVIIIPVLPRSLPFSAQVKRQQEEKKVGYIQNLLVVPCCMISKRVHRSAQNLTLRLASTPSKLS